MADYKRVHDAIKARLEAFNVIVPDFEPKRVFTVSVGIGFYKADSGAIVANKPQIYGHEGLHWASVHVAGIERNGKKSEVKVETGIRLFENAEDQVGEQVKWLDEALISEMAQRVGVDSGFIPDSRVILEGHMSDIDKDEVVKYVIGTDTAKARRMGDFFGNRNYSVIYGRLLRAFISFIQSSLSNPKPEISTVLEKVREEGIEIDFEVAVEDCLVLLWNGEFNPERQGLISELIVGILTTGDLLDQFRNLSRNLEQMGSDSVGHAIAGETVSILDSGISATVQQAVDELESLLINATSPK